MISFMQMKITQARSITVVNNKITIMSLVHEGSNKQKVYIFFDSTIIQCQSIRGAGTANPSGPPEFTTVVRYVRVLLDL
jgi:hypothetical protein